MTNEQSELESLRLRVKQLEAQLTAAKAVIEAAEKASEISVSELDRRDSELVFKLRDEIDAYRTLEQSQEPPQRIRDECLEGGGK